MRHRGIEKVLLQDFYTHLEGKYDTILFLMNGAGMAKTIDNLGALLRHAARLLAKGGNIYLESTDLLYMYEDEDGSVMIDLAGKYYGEIIYQLQYKDKVGEPFPWLFVDFENLSHIAEMEGLQCDAFYRGVNDNFIARLYHKE